MEEWTTKRRPLGEALPHVVAVISPVGMAPLEWRGEAQSPTAASGDGGMARRGHRKQGCGPRKARRTSSVGVD